MSERHTFRLVEKPDTEITIRDHGLRHGQKVRFTGMGNDEIVTVRFRPSTRVQHALEDAWRWCCYVPRAFMEWMNRPLGGVDTWKDSEREREP